MQYQNHTDETLVMLTLAGEQDAYEALVVRYQKAVIAAARRVTGNLYMAEDAAQDAFVTAWMKLNTLREAEKFSAWVCRIAKNCALNMVTRYRSFIDFDQVENQYQTDDPRETPEGQFVFSEEMAELHKSLHKLPARVGQIIHLHYFEGLSIAEIADRMRISEGTVKWQLHDGRKRIRKELSAMNEQMNDSLVERVMEKVEELKLWQVKIDKTGFESVYEKTLREVEDLPERGDKYHALADVLMRGWWWLPGDKNDALFRRIREAAIEGKNDEVMEFIVTREDSQVYGGARIDFVREKQIPMLEKAGFVRSLGREWFWLGYAYFREGLHEQGREAFNHVRRILNPSHAYRALVPGALKMEERLRTHYKDKNLHTFRIGGAADELRYLNGELRFWNTIIYGEGYLCSFDDEIVDMFRRSAHCDGRLFDSSMQVGDTCVGTNGTTLTYASNEEQIETPAGNFDNCQLWITSYEQKFANITIKNYYKPGVGIVKHEALTDGECDVRLLSRYHLVGGEGLLPLAPGNTWEYCDCYRPDCIHASLRFTVEHADTVSVIISSEYDVERLKYDDTSWSEMIQAIRNEYLVSDANESRVNDVSYPIERAKALAKTPMELAHTEAATAVAQRIMDTDPIFNRENKAIGYWNFFRKLLVEKKDGTVTTKSNHRYSFECKEYIHTDAARPLLYNDVYGILEDATNCLWSDEWGVGASPALEFTNWSYTVKTKMTCREGGTVVTKAGTFDQCLTIIMDIEGMTRGISYRGGHKEYTFAPGIGIVRTVSEYSEGTKKAIYELTSYEGTGEGYMPIKGGLKRRYDAIGLTDGYVGAAEYTYVEDELGHVAIFVNQIGIQDQLPPITQYSAISYEVEEKKLWESGKETESREAHAVNNFRLLIHFLGRVNRNLGAPESAAAWGKYHLRFMESMAKDGKVPSAWIGRYWRACFATACALFGCNTPESKEEGYHYLARAFEIYPEWTAIPDGEELAVGDPLIYGNIKLYKGKGVFRLPDGTLESLGDYTELFNPPKDILHYGMTATRGWEWFDPVRHEKRFKQYVARARALIDTE